MNFEKHIIRKGTSLNDALFQLNQITLVIRYYSFVVR